MARIRMSDQINRLEQDKEHLQARIRGFEMFVQELGRALGIKEYSDNNNIFLKIGELKGNVQNQYTLKAHINDLVSILNDATANPEVIKAKKQNIEEQRTSQDSTNIF